MEFRLATCKDSQKIQQIFDQGTAYFKELGIDQWQDGYPNEDVISDDISKKQCYVACDKNDIYGVIVMTLIEEDDYLTVEGGAWRYEGDYGVIHRLAVNKNYPAKGLSYELVAYAEQMALEKGRMIMRVDTHKDNLGMRHLLAKSGYQYIGDLMLSGGLPRIGLDKKLTS